VYDEDAERWRELAKQAVDEQDAGKFFSLIQELNEILERKLHNPKEKNQPFQRRPTEK
jgi:hypothetical protein